MLSVHNPPTDAYFKTHSDPQQVRFEMDYSQPSKTGVTAN